MAKTAFFDCTFPWQPIETAPSEAMVLVWGNGPVRFGQRDREGQWRAMHHGPVKTKPKFWMPVPRPPQVQP